MCAYVYAYAEAGCFATEKVHIYAKLLTYIRTYIHMQTYTDAQAYRAAILQMVFSEGGE